MNLKRLSRYYKSNSGKKAPLQSIFTIPYVIWLAVKRRFFNIFPILPWVPFNVIKKLESIIKKDFLVLEVGSGMSTVWLSNKVNRLYSREADLNWYNTLTGQLKNKQNVELVHMWEGHKMSNFDEFPDSYFDLIFIDGGPREQCLVNSYVKVKSGGFIYVDNIDDPNLVGNSREVLGEMQSGGDSLEFFADFVPGNFMVNEGALLKKR